MNHIPLQTVTNARTLVAILMFAFVLPALETSLVLAQITTAITPTTGAGDLGTIVTPNNNVYGITEGTPIGNNLFHSFAQFSVGTGDVAQLPNDHASSEPSDSQHSRSSNGPESLQHLRHDRQRLLLSRRKYSF